MASDAASLPAAFPTDESNCNTGTSTRARPASPAASRILLPDVYALYGATLPASGRLWIESPSGAGVPRSGQTAGVDGEPTCTAPSRPPPPHAARRSASRTATLRIDSRRVQPLCRARLILSWAVG